MEFNKESILRGCPNILSYECTKKIIEQMEKCICKINIGNEQGTGFFCKIPFPDKNHMIPVFMTNNHLINENAKAEENIKIKIKEEKITRKINLNKRLFYTNKDYDITIIELKENEISNYLELDEDILNEIINNDDLNEDYIDKTIYIIQYPEGELSVSYGILDKIYEDKKYNFNHKCSTRGGSSGSPILYKNNKLIGIHKEGHNNQFNKGLFLNYPIKEFINLYSNKKQLDPINHDNIKINNDIKEFNFKFNDDIEKIHLNNSQKPLDSLISNIILRDVNNKYHCLSLPGNTTILELDRIMIDKIGKPKYSSYRYTFQGHAMKTSKTLEFYNVDSNSTIYQLYRLNGGNKLVSFPLPHSFFSCLSLVSFPFIIIIFPHSITFLKLNMNYLK